ncbi:hypothetical protein ACOSP7_020548 [Xanthoceras sorbifolium]
MISRRIYLGIQYNRPISAEFDYSYGTCGTDLPVWVVNRNHLVLDQSGIPTIDSANGNLNILHNGGNPIEVSSVRGAKWKMIIFLLKIVLDGCLEYDNELALLCHSLGSCENDEIPICRNGVPFFQHRTGLMSEDGFKFKESDNMTFEECSVVFLFYIL